VGDGGADMLSGPEPVSLSGKYDDKEEYSMRGGLGTCTGLLDLNVGDPGISMYSTLGEQFQEGVSGLVNFVMVNTEKVN